MNPAADTLQIDSRAPEETEALGARLATLLAPGHVIALFGDLATGKTCLVRGMAAQLAPGAAVHSPTFTLVNQYGTVRPLFHIDLYRITHAAELAGLGYEELFDPDGISVIEWAERAGHHLPRVRLDIHLGHGGGDLRRIVLQNHGLLAPGWTGRLAAP